MTPITLIAKKAIIANPKVTAIWLVTVKLNGTIPTRLQKNIKEKILNNIGKYKDPFFFTFSDNTLKKINSYKNSAVVCQTLGIRVAFATAKLKKRKATAQEMIAKIEEFVIEKSSRPIKMGITLLIENCSSGEKIDIKIKKRKSKVFLRSANFHPKN